MKLTDETKFLAGIIIVTIILVAGAFIFMSRPAAPPATLDRSLLAPVGAMVTGNASASAYLVEFSDYECPACGAFKPTVDSLLTKYGDRIAFYYRDFPLDQHPRAIPAALAARAAGAQGKYWEMHDLLFANQADLSDENITRLAGSLELDMDRFNTDLKSDELKKAMETDRTDGYRAGVNATPTFFLNGVKLELNNPGDLEQAMSQFSE